MAILVGESINPNIGEKIFLSKACEYLDDTCVIYRNKQVFGREFDVCILLPEKGMLVVEVKGWREDTVIKVTNNDSVIIRTSDGNKESSPQKQALSYRFSIEKYIKDNTGKFPLVFQMVCLPQIGKDCYYDKRLNIIMEESFTFLKEDLSSKQAFYDKIDQAYQKVLPWYRDSFDQDTMNKIRQLFEPEYIPSSESTIIKREAPANNTCYSRLYYFTKEDKVENYLNDLISYYILGCKLYCIFSTFEQLKIAVNAIDDILCKKGLVRQYDNLELSLDSEKDNLPPLNAGSTGFSAFNCSFNVCSEDHELPPASFTITDGVCSENEANDLRILSRNSTFNADQYFIEHADTSKNIVVQAGAGTGKTYTMISRIGFLCYKQRLPLAKMAESIIMITFTNEAADQMRRKLKSYFRNYFLLTSNEEYTKALSCIENMQISTIHSYAKKLISLLGTEFGYGIDVAVTSSEFSRREEISSIVNSYIKIKQKERGKDYTDKLGVPIYEIENCILDFINRLYNKSIDVPSIETQDFGTICTDEQDESSQELHELFAYAIPKIEEKYLEETRENNRIHLSALMSTLHKFVCDPKSEKRIKELKNDNIPQFMFIDEFQDTDDTQIEIILKLEQLLDLRLFVVGDIKQCIYRFRGATEKAFDKLNIQENKDKWLTFTLQKNYRTDKNLLKLYDQSFSKWGTSSINLLPYNRNDELIGVQEYNSYLLSNINRFYRCIPINSESSRIPALFTEINRLQARIHYEESKGYHLSDKEKSIAVLVRENWQAELIKKESKNYNLDVHISSGGDLYSSQPALDMLILVNALIHFDEADYLYNLACSNFFKLDMPRSNLYNMRKEIKSKGWKNKAEEKDQARELINSINLMLAKTDNNETTWEYIVQSLRTKPVLQSLIQIYNSLEPWNNYSQDPYKRQYYRLNVDLLFEQIIDGCNIDKLTINTLQQFLHGCIISHSPVDSREPISENMNFPIECITVHKAKGLEFGHVIVPFGSAAIDYIKQNQLQISTEMQNDCLQIGYSIHLGENKIHLQNNYYNEEIEKAEKAREEARILYVAMTRAIRSFSWVYIEGKNSLCWQNLIEGGNDIAI